MFFANRTNETKTQMQPTLTPHKCIYMFTELSPHPTCSPNSVNLHETHALEETSLKRCSLSRSLRPHGKMLTLLPYISDET